MERQELIVEATERNTRLEDFLFDRFPHLSRMYLREIVRDGKCEVNGAHENIGRRLRGGDFIEIHLDPDRQTAMRPENIPLEIVHEDPYLIVVNKPAGMLVHPTHRDKNGTLLNALVHHLNAEPSNAECGTRNAEPPNAERGTRNAEFVSTSVDGTSGSLRGTEIGFDTNSAFRVPRSAFTRPGLVHRLDKETSGLIVVAKSVAVHRRLARQFQKKLVEKKYRALVDGVVHEDCGLIEETIGRYPEEKRWGVKHDGKHSTSRFRVLERTSDKTLLELEPITGRTNQLRIHCATIGHPIVGDVSRGGSKFTRLCLHAWQLAFRHPISGVEHRFKRSVDFCNAGGD
ncbi:MAG TPA: RluA family pseudouridine synthase [Pyrinomonadaceae bacterium]|nr:RluA family pseudouridine synthase [Pyrinomonadaceae bacterium]